VRHWTRPAALTGFSLLVCAWLTACAGAIRSGAQQDLWQALSQGGYVLLMPHASATLSRQSTSLVSGTCAGENALSQRGRFEARQLKQQLQSHTVSVGRVLASFDCRCIETAGIVFGQAEPWSIIDAPTHNGKEAADDNRIALREAISRWKSNENLALVSHRDTIRRALGVDLQPAEVLVIEPRADKGFRLIGNLPTAH
jgi:phosphohistidine phosphatase SixA